MTVICKACGKRYPINQSVCPHCKHRNTKQRKH